MAGTAAAAYSESTNWVNVALMRNSLKPISTNPAANEEDDGEEDECSTTPKSADSRIPSRLICPPAPKKRKASSRCHFAGAIEFFNPPNLDTIFIPRVERA